MIGFGIFLYIESRGGIIVLDPQSDTTITLNGTQFKGRNDSRGIYIPTNPGRYRLRITRQNFTPFVSDVTIHRGEIIKIRPIFNLIPQVAGGSASTKVDFVRTTTDQRSVLYLGNRQTIYKLNIADQSQFPITKSAITGVKNIQWAEKADLALVLKSDGLFLQEIPSYDFRTQAAVKLAGTEVSDAIWDPSTFERIAAIYNPPTGEHSLVFADKHFTTIDRKVDIANLVNPRLVWSSDVDHILLIPRSNNSAENNLWEYTTTNGSLKQLTQSGNVGDATFSPDGKTILYQIGSDSSATLTTLTAGGDQQKALRVHGLVAAAAWKDNTSFYIPSSDQSSLLLYTIGGDTTQTIAFSFPNNQPVRGMQYLEPSHTLTFYTASTIYLSSLAL